MDLLHGKASRTFALIFVAGLFSSAPAFTQNPCTANHGAGTPECSRSVRTFQLRNVTQPNDANEIMVALRNMVDPTVKIYLVNSVNTIVMDGTAEQLDLAQRLIAELDRPRRVYRLTFTLAESESGKTVETRHVTMLVTEGELTSVKQGTRLPVEKPIYDGAGSTVQKVVIDLLDVGLSLSATVTPTASGLSLKSRLEESAVADGKAAGPVQQSDVQQAALEGISTIALGKGVTLGTIDLPGSTRQLRFEVMAEPVS